MRFGRRAPRRISVIVPVYGVEAYLPACLDSILAQTHTELEVVVVDDGSPDDSGAIADDYAGRDARVKVVHTDNHGLGAARNEGLRHVTGDLLAFADSDDVVPPDAYTVLLRQMQRAGCDFVTGSMAWWEGDTLREPPWMRRLHRDREAVIVEQHPEILGDVFAWNKLFGLEFWRGAQLAWPENLHYEDQPTTTLAYVRARRFGVVPDVVYHWRIRRDGSSITQQRGSVADLRDRFTTKRMALSTVRAYGSNPVTKVFTERVLPGDLHQYFRLIPGCDDEWWDTLHAGVVEFFASRSLARSGLPPIFRVTGWLVERGRRDDAAAVMTYLAGLEGRPVPRVDDERGTRLDLPEQVLAPGSVPREVLSVLPPQG
jgi:glycosyltransferase involved in cell wall biosynthesis